MRQHSIESVLGGAIKKVNITTQEVRLSKHHFFSECLVCPLLKYEQHLLIGRLQRRPLFHCLFKRKEMVDVMTFESKSCCEFTHVNLQLFDLRDEPASRQGQTRLNAGGYWIVKSTFLTLLFEKMQSEIFQQLSETLVPKNQAFDLRFLLIFALGRRRDFFALCNLTLGRSQYLNALSGIIQYY